MLMRYTPPPMSPGEVPQDAAGMATRRSRRRWPRRIGVGLLGVLGGAVLLVVVILFYLQFAEWRNPSGRVYIEVDGQRRYFEQPQIVVTPRPQTAFSGNGGRQETAATSAAQGPGGSNQAGPLPLAPTTTASAAATGPLGGSAAPLPPLQVVIPAIDVNSPVVLADNQHLPRVQVAGWLFKTAFPATAGNMVLLGHLDGNAAIFSRLHELRPGDEIRVLTARHVHIYVVDTSEVVGDAAVEVLAPTTESVATLITCAGDWNPTSRSYDQRLVVRAHYAAVEGR